MIITINVTQDDIDRGERESCLACPIALACKRAGIVRPEVSSYEIIDEFRNEYKLPMEARLFVHRFDAGGALYRVFPFSFILIDSKTVLTS